MTGSTGLPTAKRVARVSADTRTRPLSVSPPLLFLPPFWSTSSACRFWSASSVLRQVWRTLLRFFVSFDLDSIVLVSSVLA